MRAITLDQANTIIEGAFARSRDRAFAHTRVAGFHVDRNQYERDDT